MKKPIETWTGTKRDDGTVIYQLPSNFNCHRKTFDEKRFEAYCDKYGYRREFVNKGAGIYDIHLYPIETRQAALF
ncbi:MAG: hypothetical protein IPP15_15975 [Saprospiraceae bacterium]|uniref:Uncharacterized protein n=1 Tax=Candidatus Opimibacter skivensis TaxID=2982028 RepID=A0A9D7SY68_9BACT|nr:hypothetical protein [Candidatus Opimibacter skivensis]